VFIDNGDVRKTLDEAIGSAVETHGFAQNSSHSAGHFENRVRVNGEEHLLLAGVLPNAGMARERAHVLVSYGRQGEGSSDTAQLLVGEELGEDPKIFGVFYDFLGKK
jgi:hypothetical protein